MTSEANPRLLTEDYTCRNRAREHGGDAGDAADEVHGGESSGVSQKTCNGGGGGWGGGGGGGVSAPVF